MWFTYHHHLDHPVVLTMQHLYLLLHQLQFLSPWTKNTYKINLFNHRILVFKIIFFIPEHCAIKLMFFIK